MALIAGVVAAMRRLPTEPLEGSTYTNGAATGAVYDILRDMVDLAVFNTPADMGELLAITIPIQGASSAGVKFRGLVYDPATLALMATSAELTTTGAESSLVLTFAAPVPLSASTSYAFGAMASATPISFQATAAGAYMYDDAIDFDYASGAPDPLTSPTTGSGSFVVTLTYTPAA